MQAANVTVDGTIDGVDFSICRIKTSNKGSLHFRLDGTDLSAQSIKETQELINEKMGINPQVLTRTMFHGQHALNELLEATDTKLKDELSLLVPLRMWQAAVRHTREQARAASKRISELEGMLSVRVADLAQLRIRLEDAESHLRSKEISFNETLDSFQKEMDSLTFAVGETQLQSSLIEVEEEIRNAENTVAHFDVILKQESESRDAEVADLVSQIEEFKDKRREAEATCVSLEQDVGVQSTNVALAKERIASLQKMWNVDLSSGILQANFSVPSTCPTCHQSIASLDAIHNHDGLESTIKRDVATALDRLHDAESTFGRASSALDTSIAARRRAREAVNAAQQALDERRLYWKDRMSGLENQLRVARAVQQKASSQLAAAAKQVEGESRKESLRAKIKSDEDSLAYAKSAVQRIRDEIAHYEALVKKIQSEKANHSGAARIMGELSEAFGQRGVQTFVLQNAVELLESATQSFLDQLSDCGQKLQLSLDSTERISRRAFIRVSDDLFKERPLASLSGGQWRRCSLALSLGFADLVARRGNFRPSLFVMDEPLTHLDQSGRAQVGRVLRSLIRRTSEAGVNSASGLQVSTILIILQDLAAEELGESFDCIDEVEKRDGFSFVTVEE